jgi:hypothetical protein
LERRRERDEVSEREREKGRVEEKKERLRGQGMRERAREIKREGGGKIGGITIKGREKSRV